MLKFFHSFARRLTQNWRGHHSKADDIRLHLGCGNEYWDGYVNIDSSTEARCDICLDFSRIGDRFRPGSVSEVVMIHSLSYLRLWQARDLFNDIHRLLKPGGQLILELPDLMKCARKALGNDGNLPDYLEAVRGLYAFDMDQIEKREAFTPYAFGWSGWHLQLELERAGFGQIQITDPVTHGRRLDRDIRVITTKA